MNYKVGDRVKMRSLQWCKENIFNNEDKYPPEFFRGIEKFCGKILTISDAVDKSKYVDEGYYNMAEDTEWDYYWTDEMIEGFTEEEVFIKANDIYNEEYSKGEYCHEQSFKWGFQEGYNYSHENNKLEISLKEGYQFVDENGNVINATKIVLEKKKKDYPKTYEECAKVLLDRASVRNDFGYKGELLVALQKLLVCRDAYWKIAGEEMGLGKPWEPDYDSGVNKYGIICMNRVVQKSNPTTNWERHLNKVLDFPTPEMRDAFYENFKELIEDCKEFL